MALTDNLVGYWSLDEASGARADSTANGYNLSDNSAVGSTTGKVGGCATFNGTTQFLNRASNANLQLGDVDFSFACWVYPLSIGTTQCVASKRDTLEWELRLEASGTLRLFFGDNAISVLANTFGALSTGTWYHVVVWHDATANLIGISVNTTADTAADTGSGAAAHNGDFRIGAESGTTFFNGRVDEAGYWKRVLTSTERSTLYNGGAGLAYADLSGGGGGGPAPTHFLTLTGVGG